MKCRVRQSKGFSLIEMMIVLAVIGIIFSIAIPNVKRTYRVNLKSASRRLIGTIRYSFDHAALERRIHRVVLDLEQSKYWVEKLESKSNVYEDTLERMKTPEDELEELKKKKKQEATTSLPFRPVEKGKAAQKSLPDGIVFRNIITERTKDPVTEGKAFIHFFPHGFAERSVIQIQNEGNEDSIYSLEISPLTGQVTVWSELVEALD